MDDFEILESRLAGIYGAEKSGAAMGKIRPLLEGFPVEASSPEPLFSEKDVVLITYGDSLIKQGGVPLGVLHDFAGKHLRGVFSAIHILPFFPFSSDDGFSVKDFFAVDADLGTWEDVRRIGSDFKLMLDLVLNHISAQSLWFQNYLASEAGFEELAIEVEPDTDLSAVVRPRALPLLTKFVKSDSKTVHLWTTFSEDQIDLNYESPDVLEKMVSVLLHYIRMGASIIRLDAIAYLWKEIGTSCIHLEKTHEVVKFFRDLLNLVAPGTLLLTETNVPHTENISYLGRGGDEAQMVYNFTLPPLLLHGLISGDASLFSQWAKGLGLESDRTTFFNFTASHDGIGVRPLEGILSGAEIEKIAQRVLQNGGQVSFKQNPDGSQSPYELNITYLDALRDGEPDRFLEKRFLASQAVQLILPGVPGIYIHSLLGSRNWEEGVRKTGRARTINRQKLDYEQVRSELLDPGSLRSRIHYPYMEMIRKRRRSKAFHPNAEFRVLDLDRRIFSVLRKYGKDTVYALVNFCPDSVEIDLTRVAGPDRQVQDMITGMPTAAKRVQLPSYGIAWLTPEPPL